MKCHKPKYFRMVFHLLENYQSQNLQFEFFYVIKITTRTIFNIIL